MYLKKLIAVILALMLGTLPVLALAERSNADAYKDAVEMLQDNRFTEAADTFAALGNYSDAPQLAMYSYALAAGESGQYSVAMTTLQTLGAFRDSALLVTYYQGRAYESAEQYESAQATFADMTLFRDVATRVASYPEKINVRDYAKADTAEQNDQLEDALTGFTALGDYSDSTSRAATVQKEIDDRRAAARDAAYTAADQAETKGDYAAAYTGFLDLGSYRDSAARALALEDKGHYAQGMQYALSGEFSKAYALFAELAKKGYEDSEDKAYLLGVTTFADVRDKGNGVGVFQFHGLYGLFNINTNAMIAPYWDELGDFNSLGLAYAKKDGKYGYINAQGREVVACKWQSVSAFDGDYCTVALVTSNNGIAFGILDKTGEVITNAQWQTMGDSYTDSKYYYCSTPVFSGGKMKVQNSAGQWGYIDTQGQPMGEIQWDTIYSYNGDLAMVEKDGLYGFIDESANNVVPATYKNVHTFCEGLAAVQQGDLWQYINRQNEVVIQPLYSEVTDFSGGTADVYLPGTGWQIIDKTGALLYFIDNHVAMDYRAAVDLMAEGQYAKAYELLAAIPSYKDSDTLTETCLTQMHEADYTAAMALYNAGKYDEAHTAFTALADYKDAAAMAEDCIQQQKEADYTAAMALYNAGKYDEAYEALAALSGYKDVDTLLTTDSNLLAARSTFYQQAGRIVTYGHYEQDNNLDNGQEAIEWIVLDYDAAKNRALLLSRYGLDVHRFDAKKYQGWNKSEIRTWLNSDFLNTAFTPEEQVGIVTVQIKTPANNKIKGGADSKDQIWLLSREEVTTYFKEDNERQTTATAYAKANGANEAKNGFCWWWLRSPGGSSESASCGDYDNYLSSSRVFSSHGVVRPAFWLDLSSL